MNPDSHSFATGHILGCDLKPNEKSFDGSMSWFLFCELVKDWTGIAVVEKSQRGPHLRNRRSAALHKRAFDRDTLCTDNGVQYFLTVLKKEYIRDAPRVFMWRFTNFLKCRRRGDVILALLYKYDLKFNRLQDAWQDLTPPE